MVYYLGMFDVSRGPLSNSTNEQSFLTAQDKDRSFQNNSWINRGWTLQELLVLTRVSFYDREWTFIGGWERVCPQESDCISLNNVLALPRLV
jgi:hypothetical protein